MHILERAQLWKNIFQTDNNSILQQVSKLAWDLAAFTCFVEAIRRAPGTEDGKRLNGMFVDMLASGFWSTTMQGVRNLAERGSIHGAHGVCSIGGLLEDIKSVRTQVTRRVFVEAIGETDYNYHLTNKQYWEWLQAGEPGAKWVPKQYHYELARQRHELFDWLSGATPGKSHPDDLIRKEVFVDLDERLKRLDAIVDHVNANIAHAATEASRQGRVLDKWSLEDAKSAIKELAQIAELVGTWFCRSSVGTVLPTAQFDQFAHLDQPIFAGDINVLRDAWDTLDKEMSQWHGIDLSRFLL